MELEKQLTLEKSARAEEGEAARAQAKLLFEKMEAAEQVVSAAPIAC